MSPVVLFETLLAALGSTAALLGVAFWIGGRSPTRPEGGARLRSRRTCRTCAPRGGEAVSHELSGYSLSSATTMRARRLSVRRSLRHSR